MIYIDKSQNKQKADALISRFLSIVQSTHGGSFPSDLYREFRKLVDPVTHTVYREELTNMLLSEQSGRCCYCMKTLRTGDISREHIIPFSTSNEDDMKRYFSAQTSFMDSDIVLESVFLSQSHPTYPPFPHTISYENLWLSCEGQCKPHVGTRITCNHARKDSFIPPLLYRKNIQDEIIYCTNGFMLWTHDYQLTKGKGAIATLGLNDSTLQMYRRIWYYLASTKTDIDTCNHRDVVYEIAKDLVNDHESLHILYNFLHDDSYWKILKLYSWFNNTNIFSV